MLPLRRPLGAALVAAAISGAVVAPPAIGAESTADELDQARQELVEAEAALGEALRRIEAVQAEVAAADGRLAELQGRLARVEADLATAEAVAEDATADHAAARAQLRAAAERQQAAEDDWAAARGELEARVAAAWIHGSTRSTDTLLSGLLQADDLHEVAVVQQASERLLDRDQQLLAQSIESAAAAAEARAEADGHQQAVAQRADRAYEARQSAEQLVAEQRSLVAQAARVREDRAAALRSIEQDAAARAALVDRLDARIDELQLATLEQWLQQVADIPFDGPAPAWAARLPAAGRPVAAAINAAAARGGVDGQLLAALVWTESSFNHDAISPAGAIGLAQLMPGTAAGLGVDPYDPLQNLTGGARYLRTQLERFGRIDLALAAYNAGPGRVEQAGNAVPDIVETQLYVLRVLDRWESLG